MGPDVSQDLILAVPNYVFETPVLGGQASISMAGLYGNVDVDVDQRLVILVVLLSPAAKVIPIPLLAISTHLLPCAGIMAITTP